MAAEAAAKQILAQGQPSGPLSVADVAASTGLALRDAESGLKWLSAEYRGQLRVTEAGDLVHVFPAGFTKPWEAQDARRRAVQAAKRALSGVLHFVVRAWVMFVLVAYALVFLAIFVGLSFSAQYSGGDRRRDDDDERGGWQFGGLPFVLLNVLQDAFFWTFHPWSPFSVYGSAAYDDRGWGARSRRRSQGPKVPLYERVNRFFFGPPAPPEDPRENERRVVETIRAGKGRIGLGDVMRVTGLPREQADPMMARLMLDFDGDVVVSEEGGITYRFPELRKTAAEMSGATIPPPAAWTRVRQLPPVTGNSFDSNLAIALLNGFNLTMGLFAIQRGLTFENLANMFGRVPDARFDPSLPIVLGLVPVAFSIFLFALPLFRLAARPSRARHEAQERGRLAVLREVLDRVAARAPVTDERVKQAWSEAAGAPAKDAPIDRLLVGLGGAVAIDPDGQTRWRFADLETEATAVAAERAAAPDEEARLGEVVYATDAKSS
jgi:hypothetical protein